MTIQIVRIMKKGNKRLIFVPFFFIAVGMGTIKAQPVSSNAASACVISGVDTVAAGSTASYTLIPCAAQNWTTSCGQITSQAAGSVTISFSGMSCGSASITATNGGTILTTKKIFIAAAPAPAAVSIDNAAQVVNYGRIPQLLVAPPAAGGPCGGAYNYQWLSSTDGLNFSSIPGATGQNYQPVPLTATSYFKRQSGCGGAVLASSNSVKITVNPPADGLLLNPTTQSVNAGSVPGMLSLSSTSANVNLIGLSYQWQQADNSAFSGAYLIPGAVSPFYSPGAVSVTTYYRVAMIGNGDTLYSAPALVTVYPALYGGSVSPSSQTINSSGVSGMLSCDGASGSNGVFTYQWYSSTDNSHWTLLEGVTVQNYYPGAPATTTWFRVQVSSNGLTATSAPAIVNLNP
jgi:hypothetical protein